MLVECNVNHVRSSVLNQYSMLSTLGVLKQFLAQVVAERISHELDHVVFGLKEDHLDLLGISLFKFALQESASMLVLAKTVDLTFKIRKLDVRKAGRICCET